MTWLKYVCKDSKVIIDHVDCLNLFCWNIYKEYKIEFLNYLSRPGS